MKTIKDILRIFIHVHWIKTLILNFRLLSIRDAIKFPFVVTGKLRLGPLTGKVEFKCPLRFGLVNIGKDMDNMPIAFAPARFQIQGKIIIQGPLVINQSAAVIVWPNGTLDIAEGVRIGSGVLLKSTNYIKIGKFTTFTSGCFVMDTNVHAIKFVETGRIGRTSSPIIIGDYCWITMNSSIMPGAKIPDFSIATRYALMNKDYTLDNKIGALIGGMPAKVIKYGCQRIFDPDKERKINRYFALNPSEQEYYDQIGFDEVNLSDAEEFFRI